MTPTLVLWAGLVASGCVWWSGRALLEQLNMARLGRLRRFSPWGRNGASSHSFPQMALQALSRLRSTKSHLVAKELPQLLDLLVLACDAGMSLPDALKLAGEAAGREVGEEIRIVFEQVQSGTALSVALKEMADRTNVRAMEALARNVARGMRLGSPMSQVFRAQAHLVRQQHKQHLEAIIGALPMKMTLVAVLLLFPPMLVMILVPHLLLLFREW